MSSTKEEKIAAFWKNTILTQAEVTQIWDQTHKYFGENYVTIELDFPAGTKISLSIFV